MHAVLKRVLLVMLALAIAAPLAACSDQTAEADAAIKRANAQTETYNKLEGALTDLMDEFDALEPSPANAKKALQLADKARGMIEQQKKANDAAMTEARSIGAMDVSDEIKAYAKMQVEIGEKQAKMLAIAPEFIDGLSEIYDGAAAGTATEASMNKILEGIESKGKKLDALQKEIEKLQQVADDYFAKNQLGG